MYHEIEDAVSLVDINLGGGVSNFLHAGWSGYSPGKRP